MPTVVEIAAYLQDLFDQQLTALMINSGDPPEIGRWARGEAKPAVASERQLRNTSRIGRPLGDVEPAQAVREWFVGKEPALDDRSPADLIAKHPRLLAEAADPFRAAG